MIQILKKPGYQVNEYGYSLLTSNILINAFTYNFLIPSDFPKEANIIVMPRMMRKGGNNM